MKFKEFLNEEMQNKKLLEAEMLDISIQAASKYLTSDKKILEFLTTPCIIDHKTDGIKCTVVKLIDSNNAKEGILEVAKYINAKRN